MLSLMMAMVRLAHTEEKLFDGLLFCARWCASKWNGSLKKTHNICLKCISFLCEIYLSFLYIALLMICYLLNFMYVRIAYVRNTEHVRIQKISISNENKRLFFCQRRRLPSRPLCHGFVKEKGNISFGAPLVSKTRTTRRVNCD